VRTGPRPVPRSARPPSAEPMRAMVLLHGRVGSRRPVAGAAWRAIFRLAEPVIHALPREPTSVVTGASRELSPRAPAHARIAPEHPARKHGRDGECQRSHPSEQSACRAEREPTAHRHREQDERAEQPRE